MNKISIYKCPTKNINFAFLTILATITFMMQIYSAFLSLRGGGVVLDNVQYTIFALKISITRDTYSQVYDIINFPLLTVFIGVLYNLYFIVKCHRNKDEVVS